MPLYEYICDRAHLTESRESMDTAFIGCHCGLPAQRRQVYREQFIHAETGPQGGRKNDVPREEKSYRKQFQEFREASAEVEYAYSRVDDPSVRPPNHYKQGIAKAKKLGAKMRG